MIGIFDSGVGGLSVFREIRKILPNQSYIYYSDNAHCPYGEKSQEYIIDRARKITKLLLDKGAQIIVVACNTATAAAIATLREEFPVKFIGMEPAIKPAAACTRTGVVGVLATAGTLKADKYLSTRIRWGDNIQVVEHVGQGFVELVESGKTTGPEAEEVVETSVEPLLDAGDHLLVALLVGELLGQSRLMHVVFGDHRKDLGILLIYFGRSLVRLIPLIGADQFCQGLGGLTNLF